MVSWWWGGGEIGAFRGSVQDVVDAVGVSEVPERCAATKK